MLAPLLHSAVAMGPTAMGSRPTLMRSVSRDSVSDDFRVLSDLPVPDIPTGGARVKIYYAGACYTEAEIKRSGRKRLRSVGVQNTALFKGYEVSGIIDEVCPTLRDSSFNRGDKVIIHETDADNNDGYTDYVCVSVAALVLVPVSLHLEVAALLPSGALRAYSALQRIKPFIEDRLNNEDAPPGPVHVLIVGAGGLGLWTLKVGQHVLKDYLHRVRLCIADTNAEKLNVAKQHGCQEVIHWNESIHEQSITERTLNGCPGGVQVAVDFVSSPRTTSRCINVLNKDGVLVFGGGARCEVPVSMDQAANSQLTLLGVSNGSHRQLTQLVQLVDENKVTPPSFTVFPVEQANEVFQKLDNYQISGRAVLQVATLDDVVENETLEDVFS